MEDTPIFTFFQALISLWLLENIKTSVQLFMAAHMGVNHAPTTHGRAIAQIHENP